MACRKVGAPEKRQALGRHEYGEWPPSALGEQLDCRHVDIVYIRSFFTINFDAHKMFVEKLGNFGIHERFPLHHVTPIATGVTNREKDRFVFTFCMFKRLGTPGIPLDRIVGVHQKIRTRLVQQSIRVGRLRLALSGNFCPGLGVRVFGFDLRILRTSSGERSKENAQSNA